MKLVFIITIEEEETVDAYKDCAPDIILEDIVHGTLGEQISAIVRVPTEKGK